MKRQQTQQAMIIAARVWILENHIEFLNALDRRVSLDDTTDSEAMQLNTCIRRVVSEEKQKAQDSITYYEKLR